MLRKIVAKSRKLALGGRDPRAVAILAAMRESGRDQHPSPEVARRARDYAGDVLGSTRYDAWLKVYAGYRGEFLEGWIPDDYFRDHVRGVLFRNARDLGRRLVITRLAASEAFPEIAHFVNGNWFDIYGAPLSREDVAERIRSAGRDVFVKLDRSRASQGVSRVSARDLDLTDIEGRGDLCLQTSLMQSREFEAFGALPVATLRITTVKPPAAGAAVRTSLLRLARVGEQLIHAGSQVRIPVDLQTGVLRTEGMLPEWRPTQGHPDTGVPFAGFRVPGFDAAVALCCAAHDRLPYFQMLGWDIVIDEENRPRILEVNAGHPALKESEAMIGPSFADLGWERLWRRKGRT